MERLDEPEAGIAIRAAFYRHDHGFKTVALASDEIGDAP
jgi:hypothetical protein